MDNIHGKNINKLRKRKKLTLQVVADAAGTSIGYLHDIENKGKVPNMILGVKIADALKTTSKKIVTKPIE